MPELPEVEIISLGLQNKIVGKIIKNIQVLNPKSFFGDPKTIRGKKVLKIWRRAKILGIELSGDYSLLFHLKMSGQLVYDGGKRPARNASRSDAGRFIGGHPTLDMLGELPNKSTRVIFSFSDGSHLYFNDQRKFGWIKVSEKFKVQSEKFIKNLGPEPLENTFTWQILKNNLIKHKSMPVKAAIMDQGVVSGVGNIYANEACFDAKIDPRTKVSKLADQHFKGLLRGVQKALREGIKDGGSTRVHFVNADGQKGYFLDYAKVYWRDGQKCKVCGAGIKKIQLRGRGTYFCPHCQK